MKHRAVVRYGPPYSTAGVYHAGEWRPDLELATADGESLVLDYVRAYGDRPVLTFETDQPPQKGIDRPV